MKYCPQCRTKKDLSEFSKDRGRYDNLQPYCKDCKAKQDKQYYIQNKLAHKLRVKKYKEQVSLKVWDYLSKHPCVDCGINNPVVLEFDHIKDKKKSISELMNINRCSWKTIEKEIGKCEVRCANCHRVKTANQSNWNIFGLLAQR